jgi:hypothetical protein
MIIRDFYFGAWAIERGVKYSISEGKLELQISKEEFDTLQAEYTATVKPVLERVRSIIRLIKQSR